MTISTTSSLSVSVSHTLQKNKEERRKNMWDVVMQVMHHLRDSGSKNLEPYFGGKRQLDKLQRALDINAQLVGNVKLENQDSDEAKTYLERLTHLLRRLEDLLEEVDHRIQQTLGGGKLLKDTFQFPFRLKYYQKNAKAIIKELDDHSSNISTINFRVDQIWKEEQTRSFVYEGDIIGREKEKREIISLILGDEEFCVIPIVGMGGIGKTALAKVVFNDSIIQHRFPFRLWVCISWKCSLKDYLAKILSCASPEPDMSVYELRMNELIFRIQTTLCNKRGLLVLDDARDENNYTWVQLRHILCDSGMVSRIIVTSTSLGVAKVMGTVQPYRLEGLTDDDSWELFRSFAFQEREGSNDDEQLAMIGREIVNKCENIPLSLRIVASFLYGREKEKWIEFRGRPSLLYGREKEKWIEFRDRPLPTIVLQMMQIYDTLPPQMKRCLTYCSLFPEDYDIKKQDLIYLWMSQGYLAAITPEPEDVGDTYFKFLSQGSFSKHVGKHDYGKITHFKMDTLMGNLARVLAPDSCLVDQPRNEISNNILHLTIIVGSSWEPPSWLLAAKQIRSLILHSRSWKFKGQVTAKSMNEIFTSLRQLRALDLADIDCEELPTSIGKLMHLKYLRLGESAISLPESITGLPNLQTLDLQACNQLRELPTGFSKLTNLRHLLIIGTRIDMLPEIGQLTSLHTIDLFVVGGSNGLDALGSLRLGSKLEICFEKHHEQAASKATEANLKGKELTELVLRWSASYPEAAAHIQQDEDDSALQCLQPPPTLRALEVVDWKGLRFPRWGMDDIQSLLPNLVSIKMVSCHRCQHLPYFCRLPFLKYLQLWDLDTLEYIDIGPDINEAESQAEYFPSLDCLELYGLHELKVWTTLSTEDEKDEHQLSFPRLSVLKVSGCSKLMSIPFVPNLQTLDAHQVHGKLLKHILDGGGSASSTPSRIRELHIAKVEGLESLSIHHSSLESLTISRCQELINLTMESPCPLQRLEIASCSKLRDISGALEKFSVLEELVIDKCEELIWVGDEDNVGNDDVKITAAGSSSVSSGAWKGLMKFRSLTLRDMAKVESLPWHLGCLSTLEKLHISWLHDLKTLPEWIGQLSELRRIDLGHCYKLSALPDSLHNLKDMNHLGIVECPKLERRYQQQQQQGGEYWPLINALEGDAAPEASRMLS